jgi:archaellum biogenesis ATPase FlaH
MIENDYVIHYWKSIQKESNETIGNLLGLTLVIHNSAQFSDIARLLKKIRKDEAENLLYFSLTTSYDHIKNEINSDSLGRKQLHVVDMVSGFLLEIQDNIDCVFRRPPKTLDEMKSMMMKNIDRVKPDVVCVDSLSQFINFTKPSDQDLQQLYQFLGSLKESIMGSNVKTIILLYDEKSGPMKKLPSIFTDLIMKMEVIKPNRSIVKQFS